MKSTVTFSPDFPEVDVVLSGQATLEELKSLLDSLAADPRWRAGVRALCDFNELDARALDGDAIREWAAYLETKQEALGTAAFACVTDDSLAFGLGRQTASLTSDATFEIRFFRDRGQALAWLGAIARSDGSPG